MSVLKDTRDYLQKAMRELADSDATADDMNLIIARARATSQVAAAVVATVKTECDAYQMAHNIGILPAGNSAPNQMRRLLGSDE